MIGRRAWLMFVLLFCLCVDLCAVAGTSRALFPIMRDGKWGYIDRTGRIAIKPRFDGADDFSEGLASIKSGYGRTARYGFIDTSGKAVIRPRFVEVRPFSRGLAAVSVGKESWGYIDKSGRWAISPRYVYAGDFGERCASVISSVSKREQRLSYIDRSGKELTGHNFSWDMEGYKSLGYVRSDGRLSITPEALQCLRFSEGLTVVPSSEEYAKLGYADRSGRVIIRPQFGSAKEFSEGLAAVTASGGGPSEGKWGYIDRTGSFVIPARFDEAESFSGGLALVMLRDKGTTDVETLEGRGPETLDRFMFIDRRGKVVLRLPYRKAESFHNGLARVWIVSPDLGGAPSYINRSGKLIWKGD